MTNMRYAESICFFGDFPKAVFEKSFGSANSSPSEKWAQKSKKNMKHPVRVQRHQQSETLKVFVTFQPTKQPTDKWAG